jgi:hypothetical protein
MVKGGFERAAFESDAFQRSVNVVRNFFPTAGWDDVGGIVCDDAFALRAWGTGERGHTEIAAGGVGDGPALGDVFSTRKDVELG